MVDGTSSSEIRWKWGWPPSLPNFRILSLCPEKLPLMELTLRSHHTGLDCIEPLPWSTASMWYWPLSTLEGMECPRAFLRSARDFGEPFQREDVHFNTTWSYIIYHWSTIDHTWSYMVYHWNVPQGLCRSAKLIGRALAFHVFSLANHISPWSNSRAVASGRGPRKMMREKRKRCPWKWAWAAACWRDCLLDHNFNSWKEQVLELFHGTMSHFGSKHVSSDCYSSITTLKVPHLFDQRISWDRRHPLSWCHMKTMDHEWRRCLSWTWHVCHGHVEVYHTETIGGRSHSLLSGPSPGSQSPTNTPALGAGDPWLQYSAAVHSPSWNPVVKQTDIDQQKSDLLTCEVIRSTDTLKGNPQISTTEKYPQKKRLWLDIHHCRSAKIAGTSRTKSPFRLRAVGRSLA